MKNKNLIKNSRHKLQALPPDSEDTKRGSSNQDVSSSAGKNTGLLLVLCCTWNYVPAAVCSGVDVAEVPCYHFLCQMSCQ